MPGTTAFLYRGIIERLPLKQAMADLSLSDTPQSPIAGDVSPAARSAVKVGGSGVDCVVAFSLVTFQLVEMLHVQVRFCAPVTC